MGFRDDAQRAKCCVLLCRRMPALVDNVWSITGPTERALELLNDPPKPPWVSGSSGLSDGERAMLAVVWDLWNGRGHADLASLIYALDPGHLQSLGELLAAVGSGEVSWIDDWINAEGYCSEPGCLEEPDERLGRCAEHILDVWPDDEPIPFRPRSMSITGEVEITGADHQAVRP